MRNPLVIPLNDEVFLINVKRWKILMLMNIRKEIIV